MSFEIGEKLEVVAIAARRGGSDKLVLEVGQVTITTVSRARNDNVLFVPGEPHHQVVECSKAFEDVL